MMFRFCALFTFFLFQILTAAAQNYPRNYFRHPLDIPMQLVANFGEIRTNHWHMGLDIRTQQRVNLPVYAAADGYVSRIGVEPGGFGQAIYLSHPNGFTTLYAHMNAFFPALATWVRSRQYELQSWKVNLTLPAQLFPVKKGDLIGYSGSTGASQGPHVHFEIRDTETEKCLNPLLFGFPIPDAVPPTLNRLAMYDRNRSTYAQSPQMLPLRRSGSVYVPAGGSTIRSGSNKLSFAIGAIDRFSGTPNPNGIYSARMIVDGSEVSGFVLDDIGYDETRYINAQLDLPYQARGGGSVQHITPLPGAATAAYKIKGDGTLLLRDTETHEVVIEVSDANRNISTIRFNVVYDPTMVRNVAAMPAERMIPNQVNVVERPDFELFTSEYSIYDTVGVAYNSTAAPAASAISVQHQFLTNAIPSHDSVTVRIRPTVEISPQQRARTVIKNIAGTRTFVHRAQWQNGWLAAKFRQFGTYQAFVDEEAPTVNAPSSNLTQARSLVFTPRDNFNTIRSFRAEVDGQWLRFTNDKGRSWVYSFDEKFPRGQHELRLIIEDEAGNVLDRTWTVTR